MFYKKNGPNPENKSAWPLHEYTKVKTSNRSQKWGRANGASVILMGHTWQPDETPCMRQKRATARRLHEEQSS